jgi:hypothetical protein
LCRFRVGVRVRVRVRVGVRVRVSFRVKDRVRVGVRIGVRARALSLSHFLLIFVFASFVSFRFPLDSALCVESVSFHVSGRLSSRYMIASKRITAIGCLSFHVFRSVCFSVRISLSLRLCLPVPLCPCLFVCLSSLSAVTGLTFPFRPPVSVCGSFELAPSRR